MTAASNPSVASNGSHPNLPPELHILADFIDDDDRPTFILERSSTLPPKAIFCNIAFETLVAETSQNSSSWDLVGTLLNAADECAKQNTRKIRNLGNFAARVWSTKDIRGPWTAVFCNKGHHNAQLEPKPDTGSLESQDIRPDEQSDNQGSREHPLDMAPLKRHHSDNTSMTGSATSHSNSVNGSSLSSVDTSTLLEDLAVDWLLYPHPTSDPWISFLVNHDWDKTALGPLQSWPPVLRQMYSIILGSNEPRVIYWGKDLYMLYNEHAKFVVGELHPDPLGKPLNDVWGATVLGEVLRIIHAGVKRGRPVVQKDFELVLTRYGFPESCFFDAVFIPIPSSDGHFSGVLVEFSEITEKVLQKSRYELYRSLLDVVSKVTNIQDLWTAFVQTLEEKSKDVSYAVVYSRTRSVESPSNTPPLQLAASYNIQDLGPDVPSAVAAALERSTSDVVVLQQREKTLPLELAVSIPDVGTVDTAYVLPIVSLDGRRLSGVVVLGMSPRRALNPSIRQFAESLRDMLFKSAALFSLPSEQREAEEIARVLARQLETMTLKVEHSEQNFSRMLRDAPIGMCMQRGSDNYPVYVNDVCLELLGMSKASFYKAAEVGLAWRDAVVDEDFETVNQAWTAAIETGKPASAEFRVKSNREFGWLEINAQQHRDADGNLEYLYVWLRDVTSRKQLAEQKLADALETKRRSENFIDMISHEIRNPLAAILLLADAILSSLPPVLGDDQDSVLTTDARYALVDIAANILLCAKHQKNIIDEVLTFSKLDSKLLVLAPERLRPSETVQSAFKMVKAELDHADIHTSMELRQSYMDLAVDYVLLDPGRLLQIIINLMTNAIKFTKGSSERHITISLSASRTKPTAEDCQVTLIEPRGDGPAQPMSTVQDTSGEDIFVIFSVRDTGCGLTTTEKSHLFHRFGQASPKTYKQYGGSGLGLFISRELVELQGGQIGMHSEPGEGSTFAFYLKATRTNPPVEKLSTKLAETSITEQPRTTDGPTTSKTQAQDLHVLVVEDNQINQKVLSGQLRKAGCATVHVADHGLDALNFLGTTTFFGSAGKVPLSVVLLDVEMPTMDGLTCARHIRQLEATREIVRHVPIIGITANARLEQIASCIEAGMDEVVTKPFRIINLLPRILALVDEHEQTG